MKIAARFLLSAAALASLAGLAEAQALISAKSGMVHYTEGRVLLNGKPAVLKYGVFPQMNDNSELRTQAGRAEVLLTPGVFLRLGENSSVRMISNQLADTRLEVLGGSALVECGELLKGNAIALTYKNAVVNLRKTGAYRLDTDPAVVRVYAGQAEVVQNGQTIELKKGRMLPLDGLLLVQKFKTKNGDELVRWSGHRSEYLAMANLSAAKALRDSKQSWRSSGWLWNPYFGMFTFIPYRGVYNSFWGYSYWSPRSVYQVYQPAYPRGESGWGAARGGSPGYSTVPRTSSGNSGVMAASPAPTASSAPAAPMPRGSGGGGARTR